MAKKSLIFIDDSGDPGFKFNRGSSVFFAIACLVFKNAAEAEQVAEAIRKLKNDLGWNKFREFKFHRANDKQKDVFFEIISRFDFSVWSTIVNKKELVKNLQIRGSASNCFTLQGGTIKLLSKGKGLSLYTAVILQTLLNIGDIENAAIYLDGSGNKTTKRRISTEVRQKLSLFNVRISKFRLADSKSNDLIQVADMIAGAIVARVDKSKRLKNDYLKTIEKRIFSAMVPMRNKKPRRG